MLAPSGFTLVELLVVIGIMIVLTAMTLTMVNVTQNEDRVRAGAAQVQSYLEGARDRAIHAREPRGVRFLPDTQNPNLVTSLIYIGAPAVYGDPDTDEERQLMIDKYVRRDPTTGEVIAIFHYVVFVDPRDAPNWNNFYSRRLIEDGKTILKLGKANYTFQRVVVPELGKQPKFVLTAPVETLRVLRPYRLHLNPVVLPNQEPRLLPRGVVIDLNHSSLPPTWGSPGSYGTLDILFSPDGTVTGVEASAGVVHLVVADQADIDLGFEPGQQSVTVAGEPDAIERTADERIVSLRTQTGGIGVHNVNPLNDPSFPNDPFRYAALGETAK